MAAAVAAHRRCRTSYFFSRELLVDLSLFAFGAESSSPNFRAAEGSLRRPHEWLALRALSRGTRARLPPSRTYAHIHSASGIRAESCGRVAEGKTWQKRHPADLPA